MVTYCDLEGPAVQDNFLPHIKVIHRVVALIVRGGKGDAVTANQCTCVCVYECVSELAGWSNLSWCMKWLTLWYSCILHTWLIDLDCVIFKVVQDGALSYAVLLLTLLVDCLLEVCVETQHLQKTGEG